MHEECGPSVHDSGLVSFARRIGLRGFRDRTPDTASPTSHRLSPHSIRALEGRGGDATAAHHRLELPELDAATMLVLSYYFGTSASSRAKDDTPETERVHRPSERLNDQSKFLI